MANTFALKAGGLVELQMLAFFLGEGQQFRNVLCLTHIQ